MKKDTFFNKLGIKKSFNKFLYNLDHKPNFQNELLTGEYFKALESKLKGYYGCKYALVFSSATNALTAISLILGLRETEVITSPYNYGASLGGLIMNKNKLIFTDINPNLNMNCDDLETKITKQTSAIWTVDFGGYPHDMFKVRKICNQNRLWYIADASQSFGATINGKPASSLADVWVTSFGANKSLYAGEGGAVMTNNQKIYNKLLQFHHPTRSKIEIGLQSYSEEIPINGRMHPLAALLANELFYPALKQVKQESAFKTKLFKGLRKAKFIDNHFIQDSTQPAFFYCYAQPRVSIEEINRYLSKQKYPWHIWADKNKLKPLKITSNSSKIQERELIEFFFKKIDSVMHK